MQVKISCTMLSCLVVALAIYFGLVLNRIDATEINDNDHLDFKTGSKAFFSCPSHRKEASDLIYDEALINFKHQSSDYAVYGQTDVCYQCPSINITRVSATDNATCIFNTAFPVKLVVVDYQNKSKTICRLHRRLYEYTSYDLHIDSEGGSCVLSANNEERNPYIPIFVALGVLYGLFFLYYVIQLLHKRGYFVRSRPEVEYDRLVPGDGQPTEGGAQGSTIQREPVATTEHNSQTAPPRKQRLRSLDTFRGLSLVVMIFVNYNGGGYWFFHHSAWNGLTVADLVFPWFTFILGTSIVCTVVPRSTMFTFIMGTSIALALDSQTRRGAPGTSLLRKVLQRSAILFLLGLMISNNGQKGGVSLSTLRVPGVLQRLAVTYAAVALPHCWLAGKARQLRDTQASVRRALLDLWPYWVEWLLALGWVALHLFLTFLLPVPGCPTGYLGPGGLQAYPEHAHCTGGAAGHIDRVVFGDNHLYRHPTCTVPYQTTMSYDPEGLLGTLTSIFICFLGLQAGKVLVCHDGHGQRVARWLCWALLTGVVAGALCGWRQEGGLIPVNKNLWSLSFILALASMAFLLLSGTYLLVDMCHGWTGAPFLYPGMNSVAVYMCHEVLAGYFPVQWSIHASHASQLAMNAYGAALWTTVAAVMYRKKVFIAI